MLRTTLYNLQVFYKSVRPEAPSEGHDGNDNRLHTTGFNDNTKHKPQVTRAVAEPSQKLDEIGYSN